MSWKRAELSAFRKLIAYVPVAADEELTTATAEEESGFMEDIGAETTEEDIPEAAKEDEPGTAVPDDDKTPPAEDDGFSADEETGPDEAEESVASVEFEESEPHPASRNVKNKTAQKQRKRDMETYLNFNEIYKAAFAKIVATLKYRVKVVLCFCYID
jgi:hypothetical protein